MFSAKYRLRNDADIAKVLKSKKGAFDAACGVKVRANGLLHSRFTVVVGTKVSKNAVDRNRVKRQYREIIRLHIAELTPGYDVLFLTAKPALALDYHQKQTRLIPVLRKAGLLHTNIPVPKNPVV